MSKERIAGLNAIDEVLDAAKEARQALGRSEVLTRRLRRKIADGTPVMEAMTLLGIGDIRRDLSSRLDALESARHRAQHVILDLAVSEGGSQGEVARLWGVSGQLVSRLAKEGHSQEP